MENVTPEGMMTAIVVVLAVIGALITIDKLCDIIKKWRAPTQQTGRKLADEARRLDAHDEEIRSLKESSRVQCAALIALLDHELHNGNADQMQTARDDITRYLQSLMMK